MNDFLKFWTRNGFGCILDDFELFRTGLNYFKRFRTVLNNFENFRTIQYNSDQFRTIQNNSERLETIPNDSKQFPPIPTNSDQIQKIQKNPQNSEQKNVRTNQKVKKKCSKYFLGSKVFKTHPEWFQGWNLKKSIQLTIFESWRFQKFSNHALNDLIPHWITFFGFLKIKKVWYTRNSQNNSEVIELYVTQQHLLYKNKFFYKKHDAYHDIRQSLASPDIV